MKSIFRYAVAGAAALVFCSALPSAKADTLSYMFTVAQLEAAIASQFNNTTNKFAGVCNNNLDNCGIYAFSFYSNSLSGTASSYISPAPSSGAGQWGSYTFASPFTSTGIGDLNEVGGSIEFISTNANTVGRTYSDFTNAQTGLGLISATTSLGAVLTGANVVYGAANTITLEVIAEHFNADGTQAAKGGAAFVTMVVTAVPEPSTFFMIFSGAAAIALSRFRRFRK